MLRASHRAFSTSLTRCTYQRSAGNTTLPGISFPVYTFEPHASVKRDLVAEDQFVPTPAIIVLSEWWGVNNQIKSFGERIANGTGAITVVPDLYKGKSTLDAAEAEHLMSSLDWPGALNELEALVASLRQENAKRKIGSVGFCMGGAMSLALAGKLSSTASPLNAAVSFYGIPSPQLVDISKLPLTTPVQTHFGEADTYKGFSDPESAKALAKSWNVSITQDGGIHSHGLHKDEAHVYLYENQTHAFMTTEPDVKDATKPLGFRPASAELQSKVWKRVFEFFRTHLKSV